MGGSPPDLEEMLRKGQDRLKKIFPGGLGGKGGIAIIAAIALVIWGLTGLYRVLPDEQGVVLRFGEFVRTASPGLNYHVPSPIESVQKPNITQINTITIGFIKAGDITELKIVGLGVDFVTGLGINFKVERLIGCHQAAERVYGT